MRKPIWITAAMLLVGQWQPRESPGPVAPSIPARTVDEVIQHEMAEAGVVGIGAAIIVRGKVAWSKGYGFADRQRGTPFTPNTIMNIGSISKTFTGVAMMRAVQEGKLSLDADVNDYLPFRVRNPDFPAEKITLRQLATHTSGITDRSAVYDNTYYFDGKPEPLGDFLKSYFLPGGRHYSGENFLNARPGTHREYSNIGAGLAGYIVELATKQKLGAYARQRIFMPLGMKSTGWSLSEIDLARHSKLYLLQDSLAIPIGLYEGTTYPDGGVRTSVSDLSRFFIALLNDGVYAGTRILDKQTVDEMLRFQFTDAHTPDNVNLKELNSGLFWATKFNATRIGHSGTDPGVKTEMLASIGKEVAVILFSNTSLSGAQQSHHVAILNALFKHAESFGQ